MGYSFKWILEHLSQSFVTASYAITASYALNGGGSGAVGPGKQDYVAYFSGSSTAISSSTISIERDLAINQYDAKQYVINVTNGFNVSESYGSTLAVNNDTEVHGSYILVETDTINTRSLAKVIKEIDYDFITAWVDFTIQIDSTLHGAADDRNNDYATMFGTIMINRNPALDINGGNVFHAPGGGVYDGLTFLTDNRINATNYYIDGNIGLGSAAARYTDKMYGSYFGINTSDNQGDGTTLLDFAWMANDFKNPGGAGFAFQAIETVSYLPDIFDSTHNYDMARGGSGMLSTITNPLQQESFQTIKSSDFYGIHFAYDIIETDKNTGLYKLRIWCINATGHGLGPSGNTSPVNVKVTTKTRLLHNTKG